ncbi:MAG: PrgI family protein [Candidatus Nomurabacteria bacterium]|jgi:hypothetical protein|nr:PrgI family protein [Candidatus Nomurabacteria bacterium]
MSTYTVPQDVEADDKLLGPFSFRQFIYLIIVAFACLIGWLLSQIFIGLIIVPLPIVVFFGALALPLKKDQPMEVYLMAILSFYLKPNKRLWKADGKDHIITITAPKVVEPDRTKSVAGVEALQRLSYLSDLTDSGGWAIKGASSPVNDDIYRESLDTTDMFDSNSQTASLIGDKLEANNQRMHEQAMNIMKAPAAVAEPELTLPPRPPEAPAAPPTVQHFTAAPGTAPAPTVNTPSQFNYNPYPEIKQAVIQPLGSNPTPTPAPTQTQPVPAPEPIAKPVNPDIINLANNQDLTVETIAREAHRIEKKKADDGEVFVSLH